MKIPDIKRFSYVLESSRYIHDIEQKGHGLDGYVEGFYGEYKDPDDKDDPESKAKLDDDIEEENAIDIDTDIDYESKYDQEIDYEVTTN